jgi:hypothetical protein
VALHLTHLQYGPVFTSCLKDADAGASDNIQWTPGNYTYVIELPVDILRGGDYTLSASAAIPKVEVLDEFRYESAFYLLDTTSPVAKTAEGRGGAILPVITWKKRP